MPARNRHGGLHRGTLFDTNVPATTIDKDIFTDQEVEDTIAGDDLVLMLDVSDDPDKIKYMTRSNFVAGLAGSTITVTDNESTDENNLVTFVAGAATTTGLQSIEMDGDFHYNPSTGRLTATQLAGTLQTASQTNITAVGTIATGTWEATDVGVAHGGTGVSTLLTNAILTGNGASAIQAETDLLFSSNKLIPTSSAHDAAGTTLTVSAGATTAGTSNNQAGGALTFQGGQGKGSGAGGAIIFQVANEGGSGSALNSLVTALTINDDGTLTTVGAIELGNSGDTTLARSGSGDITIEGNAIYRAGGTDVAVTDGGTGASSLSNLITLTTHTTGNYVATVTGGTGIASTGATSGEGIAHSLSLDLSELADTAIANGDYIVFTDTTDSNATVKGDLADVATLFAGTGLTASSSVIGVDASQTQVTAVGTIATGTWEATDVGVAHGGTGVSTLLTNAILTGNGASAIQAETDLLFSSNKLIPTASAHDAAGTTLTVSAGATTAGTSNNQAGGALTFQGGQGKGSGAGGAIIFQTANAAGSGSSLNALATRFSIEDSGKATFAAGFDVGSDASGDVLYHNGTSYVRLAKGSDDEVLTLASGVPSWASATVGDITAVTAGVGLSGGGTGGGVTLTLDLSELSTVTPADGDFFSTLDSDGSTEQKTTTTALATLFAGTGITASSSVLNLDSSQTFTSSSANEPVLTLTNTHADATAGYLKFIKDPGSGQGADSDILGTITFHGTDASNNAPEELARIESYVIEADHGSEAGGMKFYVAENDATMTAGLQILGQATDNGEIDVTIGAGAASTTTIAGTLTMGSTAALTNAGLVSVANQSGITGLGTVSSGTWEATDVGVAHGGTGVSTLLTNAVLTGNGTSAIQAESTLLFSSNKLIPTASAHDAAGTALTMSAGATTAGTSNNQAGGALTFQGGQGKGSGAGGAIVFQVANEAGSGSSLNALATALTINDDKTITTAGAIELGHASDTTIARASSGDITIEGNAVYRAGGTDVAIADGGTGAGTATAGFDALSPMTAEGDILYGGSSGTVTKLAKGSDGEFLKLASGVPSWASSAAGAVTALNSATANELVTVGATTTELDAEANLTYASDLLTTASSSADLPRIDITNTHAGATAGKIRFNKDSASGDDNDVMGTIEWYGTDAGEATHEKLAYIDSYVVDATAGGEQGGLRFYVAENAADLALGLSLVGQAEDGEVDVTVGAGAASVTTIAGTLTMGSTAAMTNAGLVAVANQSSITGLGTVSSGTWEATDVAVAHGGTGVSTLLTNAVLTGNGTSAIQAESTLLFTSNKLIPTASAHDAAGTVLTMSAGATTAGTSNNQAGGALTFQGGQGKGSGAGGAIIFQVANEGGSGSSLNALATALTINDDSTITTAGAIELGHASDTTLARSGSGDLTIEGNAIYRAGGTDVAVADGGTGQSNLNNLITMGTHTTGNYVATVTAGTGLTSTGATSGESIAHSLSVDAAQTGITSLGTQAANFAVGNGYGVVIGDATQETVSIGDGSTDLVPELQVLGTAAADSSLLLAAFSTTATTAGSPIIAFAKGGNATLGSHTVVTDGEELGNIIAFGDDGTDLETPAASIQFEVDGTPGSGDMPGRIILGTTADGATAVTEAVRIDASQNTTFSGDVKVTSDTDGLVLGAGGDVRVFSANTDGFIAEHLTAGSAFEAHWETADSDGSDNLVHNIWGVGKHDGYTNRERLVYGKISNEWVFNSDAAGTGTVRPIVFQTASTDRLEIGIAGGVYINDSANANITTGLTINQGAADNQILALKSSDVAHGVTGQAETDTFGAFSKAQATSGGLVVSGYKDADGIAGAALQLNAVLGEAAHTNTDDSAYAAINFIAKVADGTGTAVVADAGNMASFSNGGSTTHWIIKGNGDVWQNGNLSIDDGSVIKLGAARPADDEPASNNTGYGVVILFDAGAAVAIGDAVSIGTDGRVIKTVADATGTLSGPCIGIATTAAGSADDDVYVMTHGIFRHDDWGLTAGSAAYIEEADPGDLSATAPNDDGDYVQRVGVAVKDDVLLVMPSIDVIEHA